MPCRQPSDQDRLGALDSEDNTPSVTIYVASINTARATELCIRSVHEKTQIAHRTVVGDCGSTDRTLPMLMRQLRAGRIDDLELAPHGRDHGSWIDHWIATCQTTFAAFVDSDVEILSSGWLDALLSASKRSGAACVAAEILPEYYNYVDVFGHSRRLSRRPSPWMMLVDVAKARGLASFCFTWNWDENVPEGARGYDTGAKFLEELEFKGDFAIAAPSGFERQFRHYGGLSWTAGKRAKRDWRLRALQCKVMVQKARVVYRLLRYRRARFLLG